MILERLIVKIDADTDGLTKGLGGVSGAMKSLAGVTLRLAPILGLAMVGRSIVRNSIEAQDALAQLQAAVRSTGGAAGRTVPQLEAMSNALQQETRFSAEAVQGAQSLLLTFTKIRGPIFDQATIAVTNLAARMGGDLSGAALQLGKALNDPIKGIAALTRMGIQFSEEQKRVIAALVETGDMAKAQGVILAEIEVQFGGSAHAARNTLGGALAYLANQWGDLFEVAGDSSAGIVGAINAIGAALPKVREEVDKLIAGFAALWAGPPGAASRRANILRRVGGGSGQGFMGAGAGGSWGESPGGTLTPVESGGGRSTDFELAALKEKLLGLQFTLADVTKAIASSWRATLNAGNLTIGATDPLGGARGAFAAGQEGLAAARARNAGSLSQIGMAGGRAISMGGSAAGGRQGESLMGRGLGSVVEKLKGLGGALGGLMRALNPWQIIVQALGHALGDFLTNVTPIVDLLASALMPILKALYPAFKLTAIAATYVGQLFFNVSGWITKAVGGLLVALGKAINFLLPGNPANGLIKLGKGLEAMGTGFMEAAGDLASARDDIKKLEWEEVASAANKTAEALTNVPDLLNVNRLRMEAAGGGALAAAGARAGNVTFNVTINGAGDPKRVVDVLMREVRQRTASGDVSFVLSENTQE